MMDRARGIDVNSYHPIIDFAALDRSNLSFVGVKATEGNTITDKSLIAHRDGLRKLSLDLVIYYHFARSGDPVKQAARLMAAVGPLRPNERLCLDLEVLPDDTSNVLTWMDEFYARIARSYPAMRQFIYTSNRIWQMIGSPVWTRALNLALWAPRYSTIEPVVPAPWSSWTIWQYTDGGEHGSDYGCPGVGECDANVWNGDRNAVRTWLVG